MNSTKLVSRLPLLAAFVCAAFAPQAAAQRRPAEASVEKVRAESAAPRALWKDVRVEFEGNRLFTSERLRGLVHECYGKDAMEFEPERLDYCLRTHVLGFVRRSGYLRAELGKTRAEQTGAGETLTVPIDEKELYRLGRVKLEGAEFFTPARLREMLPLKSGDIADGVAVVRWLSEHLKKLYADEGFIQYEFDVEPEFSLDTDTGEGVADLSVTINEGRRFRLQRLKLASSADVPEDALREALGLREGEVFRAQEFADGVRRMNQLKLFDWDGGRFEDVDHEKDVEFRTDEETGDLEITIRLNEKGRGQPAQKQVPDAAEDEGRPGRLSLKARRPQTREE